MHRQLYFLLTTVVLASSSFFINYHLSQKLTLSEYGHFSLVYAAISLFLPFMLFGQATSATSTYFSDEKKNCNNISNEMIISYKIMGLSSIFTSVIVLGIWNFFYITNYAFSFVVLFLFAIFFNTLRAYYLNIIVIFDKYKLYLTTVISSSLVLILTVLFNPSVIGYLNGVILNSIILIAVGLYLHKQNHQKKLKSQIFSKKELFVLGWAAIPGMLVSSLNSYVDRYTIGYFLDLEVVAYYSLAAVVGVGVGTVFITAILKGNSISMLQILQENNKNKYLNLQKNINYILIAIALISSISYYFIGEWLVISVFGDKYTNSIDYILPLFLTIIVNGAMQIYATPLVQKKKLYILLYISIVIIVINIILNILFINFIGIKGVVFAMFLAALINLIIVYFYAKKYFNYLRSPYLIVGVISSLEIFSLL